MKRHRNDCLMFVHWSKQAEADFITICGHKETKGGKVGRTMSS